MKGTFSEGRCYDHHPADSQYGHSKQKCPICEAAVHGHVGDLVEHLEAEHMDHWAMRLLHELAERNA